MPVVGTKPSFAPRAWMGSEESAATADAEVSSERSDAELSDGIDPRHLRVFDDLYATLDAERPLTQALPCQVIPCI